MALPIRPGSGLPVARPAESLPDLGAMPELPTARPVAQPAPATPPQSTAPKQKPVASATPAAPTRRSAKAPVAPAPAEEPEDGYAIDGTTGKRYKRLPGFKPGVMSSKAAVSKASNGGMSLDQLRATVIEDPDLNLDDLNGSADLFLAHLRVPPNKEEQKRLFEEKAKREKAYEQAHVRVVSEEEDEED